jgi:hypothetical protein
MSSNLNFELENVEKDKNYKVKKYLTISDNFKKTKRTARIYAFLSVTEYFQLGETKTATASTSTVSENLM